MTLNHNTWNTKDENIFVMYDDIIKCACPQILNTISSQYRSAYNGFIDLSIIDNMDLKDLLLYSIKRSSFNILETLAIKDFDFEGAFNDIIEKDPLLYAKSQSLKMVDSLIMLKNQKFTNKIFIYTHKYDVRIHMDIQDIFKEMGKIVYMAGDFHEAVKDLKDITTWIVNDITLLPMIFFENKANYTNILVPEYGYNYFYDEDDKTGNKLKLKLDMDQYMKDHVFKFATFSPYDLDISFFEKD